MEFPATEVPGAAPHQAHEAVLAAAESALDEVDRALARLDDGSYGSCEVCGDAIDDDALASAPAVRNCRAHLPLTDRNQG